MYASVIFYEELLDTSGLWDILNRYHYLSNYIPYTHLYYYSAYTIHLTNTYLQFYKQRNTVEFRYGKFLAHYLVLFKSLKRDYVKEIFGLSFIEKS